MEKIIEIPEGHEARIEGNKVVLEPKESEDERIRKEIISELKESARIHGSLFRYGEDQKRADFFKKAVCWLEKQKEPEFTHHEVNESLRDAVTHQMEDDGDVDDFIRRGIDDIALKYAMLGARWQKEQQELPIEEGADLYFDEWKRNFPGNPTKRQCFEEGIRYSEKRQKEQKPVLKFRVGDLVKDTNHHKCPVYKITGTDKECYICESSNPTLGDKVVMHFTFDNPYLRLVEQKPAEWSEGDETMLKLIISELEDEGKNVNVPELYRVEINWLKSLHPQPRWKPSEEQMTALSFVKENFKDVPSAFNVTLPLIQLYDDLKELM